MKSLLLTGLIVMCAVAWPRGSQAGGSQAGGSQAGGSQAGGSQAGGSQAGGSQAGGSQAGGSQAGGSQAGGSQAGGSQAGGSQAGGSQAGGSQAGGSQAGGSQAGGSQEAFTKSGWFQVLWGDASPGTNVQARVKYFLVDDQGEWIELKFVENSAEPFGNLLAFDRKRVRVVGDQTSALDGSITVRAFALDGTVTAGAAGPGPDAVIGTKRWITILCRFADSTSLTTKPASYFDGLMGDTYPGLDQYWRESSYGVVNLTGSRVVGWYNLPQPRSYYVYGANLHFDFDRAVADATAVADADVFFPDFYGINFIFNEELDGFSWGGGAVVSKDGLIRQAFGATYLPPSGYANQSRMAHEMGHGFGLPHSSGPYAATYDSQWDPMSAMGICAPGDVNYGCVGVHTIAYHKDKLGWVPPLRKYVAVAGSNTTINIERLGVPVSNNNYLMAKIPIGISVTRFYTVEARLFAGYDGQVPGQAIIIHEVNLSRGDRAAQVVDPDNNGDPNDAGAMWLEGETFSDATNRIQVTVNSSGASSFNVTIANAPVPLSAPTLLFDETSGRAAALDSVTSVRDAFSVINPNNLSVDQRTRVTLFAVNVELMPGENNSVVTAQAEDANGSYPLVVEFIGKVPNFDWLTQIIVKLPDQLANAGDVQVSISLRGVPGNKVLIRLQ